MQDDITEVEEEENEQMNDNHSKEDFVLFLGTFVSFCLFHRLYCSFVSFLEFISFPFFRLVILL